jgi:hypothetical protein
MFVKILKVPQIVPKSGGASLWANFSQHHLVTLFSASPHLFQKLAFHSHTV